jgi:YjbE family integral membrane protein
VEQSIVFLSDPQWWSALGAVIAINILLSGDNAVVIALACRDLPPEQQRRAMLGGVALAVALRVLLTLLAVYLLTLPLVKLVGGILLLWIAVKLLLPEGEGNGGLGADGGPWAAMRIIVLADLVMSFDNVVAVAAAADGDWWLLGIGLLISMPVIVYGSRLIMLVIARYPLVITFGAALLGYLAGEMLVGEPIVASSLQGAIHWAHDWVPPLFALSVVGIGKVIALRRPMSVQVVNEMQERLERGAGPCNEVAQ